MTSAVPKDATKNFLGFSPRGMLIKRLVLHHAKRWRPPNIAVVLKAQEAVAAPLQFPVKFIRHDIRQE